VDKTEWIWMNGEFVPWDDAKVHVLSHGLHYGTGVFEGIRAYETERGPAIFRHRDHLDRLHRSAELYYLELPFSSDQLRAATHELIRRNGLRSCYIRPIAFRGYGEMGLYAKQAPIDVLIAVWPWGAYLGEEGKRNGIRAKVSSWRAISADSLIPHAKAAGQYLNSVLAKEESVKAGYDEAILLDQQGFVSEGSGENIFVIKNGKSYDPELTSALVGITRDAVANFAADMGLTLEARRLTRDDIYIADEAFFTGTAAEVTPIRELDRRVIGAGHAGPVTKALQKAFFDVVSGKDKKHRHWLTPVPMKGAKGKR
jgi:branched-chain amino acid aminotransferase